MKFVLYSGGEYSDNQELDLNLIKLTKKTKPSITYISSATEYYDDEFEDYQEHFKQFGVKQFKYLKTDQEYDKKYLDQAFQNDIVFLSGGNTFYFLYFLKKFKIIKRINEFSTSGGVVAGLSAGSIIMTPNINTAAFPEFDRDENYLGIVNLKSLNFVDFEFFPHYVHTKRYRSELLHYSQTSSNPLFATPDGNGIVVNNKNMEFVGKTYIYFNGEFFSI